MKKYGIVIFFAIFILGVLLRFYGLGAIPNSLNWDEVSWGYNAYSILLTGKDEYGISHPFSFKAFGDYKQPVYVYLDSFSIDIFGLNAFAVRFPSAFLGSLTSIFVYLLIRELFKKQKYVEQLSLLTMFLFAISPWSIQFSRVAFEANVGLFFVILGVWLFIRSLQNKNIILLIVSELFLSVSCYTYHSEKIFTPLLFIGLLFYGVHHFRNRKMLFVGVVIFFIACNLPWMLDARTTARGKSVMFTSNQTQILASSTKEVIYDQSHGDSIDAFLHNRRFVYAGKYLENYLSHFDLNFLFLMGDNPRHHPPAMGNLYLISLPFILLGIYFLINNKIGASALIFYWLIIAPVASALAVDAPNASRSEIFLPTWEIFEAYGLVYFAIFFKSKKRFALVLIAILMLYFGNFAYYIHQYFDHTNSDVSQYWQYGYKQAVEFANKNSPGQRTFFSQDFEQPYIFYLFYSSYDPRKYIASGGSSRIFQKCFSIDNAYFGSCPGRVNVGNLYITMSTLSSDSNRKVRDIDYAGKSIIKIYQKI